MRLLLCCCVEGKEKKKKEEVRLFAALSLHSLFWRFSKCHPFFGFPAPSMMHPLVLVLRDHIKDRL